MSIDKILVLDKLKVCQIYVVQVTIDIGMARTSRLSHPVLHTGKSSEAGVHFPTVYYITYPLSLELSEIVVVNRKCSLQIK